MSPGPARGVSPQAGGQPPVADPAVVDEGELEDELDVSEELGEDVDEDESAVFVDASFEPVASLLNEDDEDESLARLSVR
jgi:hypothetical protein